MTRLPRPTGAELLRALGRKGFAVVRVRGSHHFLQHADGRATVVPVHGSDIFGPGLLTKILRDVDLSREELSEFL